MTFSFKYWWRQGVTLLWDLNALCKRSCAHARRPAVVLLLCWHQSLHQLRSPEQTFKVTRQHEKQVHFWRQKPSQSGDKWEESECLLPKWNSGVVKSSSVQLSCRVLAAVSTPSFRCALLSCDFFSSGSFCLIEYKQQSPLPPSAVLSSAWSPQQCYTFRDAFAFWSWENLGREGKGEFSVCESESFSFCLGRFLSRERVFFLSWPLSF